MFFQGVARMRRFFWLGAVAVLAISAAWGDVTLHAIFADNMMLQRNKPIPVWGTADAGEAVSVTLDGVEAKTTANANGEWQVQLPARASGENLTMTVVGKNTLTVKNIIMGDVWLCAGQSNMEFSMNGCACPEENRTANYPKIRRYKLSHSASGYAESDIAKLLPQDDPWHSLQRWLVCDRQTVGVMSATAYFFAREVHQQTGVPIGLLEDNCGGTTIDAWLSPATLDMVPEVATMKKSYDDLWANFRKQLPAQMAASEAWFTAAQAALANNRELPRIPAMPRNPVWAPGDGWKPYSLFNGMISPVLRVPITGVIWYQGETNLNEDDNAYFQKMRVLIGGWRKLWQQGDFPFYYMQLANVTQPNPNPAGGDNLARIRSGQLKAMSLPHTGMGCAIDIGEADDVHAKNKQDVGKRLALWALRNEYGKQDIVPSGPIFKEAKIEGKTIRLSFDYVGSGLMVGKKDGRNPTVEATGAKLQRFAIAGADQKWVWADAVIDGNTVVVSSDTVPNPVAVRYAYCSNPAGANLYNKEGLPASPFRTDSW